LKRNENYGKSILDLRVLNSKQDGWKPGKYMKPMVSNRMMGVLN